MLVALGPLLNSFKKRRVITDSWICRLHYLVTLRAFLFCSLLVTAGNFAENRMVCMSASKPSSITDDLLNVHCLVEGTFSVAEAWNKTVGVDVPYPGVDNNANGKHHVFHHYYKWVALMLLVQSITFYIPRYLWRNTGGRPLENWISSVNRVDDEKTVEMLANNFIAALNKEARFYYWYTATVFLYFINVILQFLLTDMFLDGEFAKLGIDFAEGAAYGRIDPLVKLFPTYAKCSMFIFGNSGSLTKFDTICMMSMNAINQKIYIAMWFWLASLMVLSFLSVVKTVLLYFSFKLRVYYARYCTGKTELIEAIMKEGNIGDWMKIILISNNIDSGKLSEFIRKVHDHMNTFPKDTEEKFLDKE